MTARAMDEEVYDVAVVGYGPVGQALTIALAQQGHRVLVLERWPALFALPRAVTYDHEVARLLQALGVAEAMAPLLTRCERYEWQAADGRTLIAFDEVGDMAVSGWPYKIAFSQPDLERTLHARVQDFGAQVRLLQGWELVGTEAADDGVRLLARPHDAGADATPRAFHAHWVAGCDGAGSFVRPVMGSAYEDLGFSADWLVVDVLPRDPALWTNTLRQICDPARPTTDVTGGPGRRRLEFMLLPGEDKAQMNNAEAAWRLLERVGWHPGNAELERHAVYTFRGCVADRWRSGRFVLAGDAAHLTPPFAGQGLCSGMNDVAGLAWRLDLVLRGQATADLLDSYGPERAPHVRRFIDFAIGLGHVICVLDPQAAAARNAQMLAPGTAPGAAYPESRLPPGGLARQGDPHGGLLSLQAQVGVKGRIGRFDDLVGRGFVLLGLDHDPMPALSPGQRAFLAALGGRGVGIGHGPGAMVEDVDGDYRRWFASLGHPAAVLVRPDFYLFGAGEPAVLVEALRREGPWAGPLQPAAADERPSALSSRASAALSETPSLR